MRSALFLLIAAAQHWEMAKRLYRNAILPNYPPILKREYPRTPDAELVQNVAVVITTKDFMSQYAKQLELLGTFDWPRDLEFVISYSSTPGYEAVLPELEEQIRRSKFTHIRLLDAGPFANSNAAYLQACQNLTQPYVLMMRSDIFPLEEQFLTELYEAAKAHPEYHVIAPELYEAEYEGHLNHHTTQTNLHLKPHGEGFVVGHDVDLLAATKHQPEDFAAGPQPDFLEDHAWLAKRDFLPHLLDPEAAYTTEYFDMALTLKQHNSSTWYQPTARCEYRVWHSVLRWPDMLFFSHRRCERLARASVQRLENKWGVHFPKTGFSNFVKFSVVRNVFFVGSALPTAWKDNAGLYWSWFQMAGLNEYDGRTLDELLPDPAAVDRLAEPRAGARRYPAMPASTTPLSGKSAADLLQVVTEDTGFQSGLPTHLLSMAIARVTVPGQCAGNERPIKQLQPFCGLLLENEGDCTCWFYIAPYAYDSPWTALFEKTLLFLNVHERLAIYTTMRWNNQDLTAYRTTILSTFPEAEFVICSEGKDDACKLEIPGFAKTAKLLQYSFRLNSLASLQLALDSGFVPSWATRLALLITVLCWAFPRLDTGCSRCPVLRLRVPLSYVSLLVLALDHRSPLQFVSQLFLGAKVAHRAFLVVLTLCATAPLSLFGPLIAHLVPRWTCSEAEMLAADGAPEAVVAKRTAAWQQLQREWQAKFPKSLAAAADLATKFSDLRFCGANRVSPGFGAVVKQANLDPTTIVHAVEGRCLVDADQNRLLDVSGSYGVNVCGYTQYQGFLKDGQAKVQDVGCVLGPLHPLVQQNVTALCRLSNKEEVSFHMSGTEAVMAALRVARFNTRRPLVVQFGGSYHGWWDGVQTAVGNERYASDVLTLKDLHPLSLQVIRRRGVEIAAVLVNPLQAFHPNAPPPSDVALVSTRSTKENREYKDWLQELRKACTDTGAVLIFDEVYTGFRLAAGGAQEYFGVNADIVCYGKTLGGGMPIGCVCGPRQLMQRTDAAKPLRLCYVLGTFSAHPLTMAAMAEFLGWLEQHPQAYAQARERIDQWAVQMNQALATEAFPVHVAAYQTVWSIGFDEPSMYHWMLAYYLRAEGLNMSWVGTGRLSFSLDFSDADLEQLTGMILRACGRMRDGGWWYPCKAAQISRHTASCVVSALLPAGSLLVLVFYALVVVPLALQVWYLDAPGLLELLAAWTDAPLAGFRSHKVWVAAALMMVERVCYTVVCVHSSAVLQLAKRLAMDPVDMVFRFGHLPCKALQLGAYLWWYFSTGPLPELAAVGPFRLLLGAQLVLLGQYLNFGIYQAIGKNGVYYGKQLGKATSWVTGFPFNVGVAHPQYTGVVLSVWGAFVLLTTPAHVAEGLVALGVVQTLQYAYMASVEARC